MDSNTNIILISSLSLIIGMIQFLLAGITFISDSKNTTNRTITFLLVFFGVLSTVEALKWNAVSFTETNVYLILQVITTYSIGPIIFLASTIILRPIYARRKLFTYPLVFLILLPGIITIIDILGISQTVFNSAILIDLTNLNLAMPQYLSLNDFVKSDTGFYQIIFIMLVGFPALTIFFPSLTVAIKDRKSNPTNSRFAWMLFWVSAISTIINGGFRDLFPVYVPSMVTNLIYALGFTYIGFQQTDSRINFTQLPKNIQNYPMSTKLLIASSLTLIPAVIITSFVSTAYLQNNVLNLEGGSHIIFASNQALQIEHKLEETIKVSTNLGQADNLISVLITQSNNAYRDLSEETIGQNLNEANRNWNSTDPNNALAARTSQNAQTYGLNSIKDQSPAIIDILLIDQEGAPIAGTYLPQNYSQRNNFWWQTVSVDHQPYISTPVFDPILGETVFETVIPLVSDRNEYLGAVISQLSLLNVFPTLVSSSHHQTGSFLLYTQDGVWIPFDDPNIIDDPGINWDTITEIQEIGDENWIILQLNPSDSLVGWSEIPQNEHFELNWIVFAPINQDEVIEPINTSRMSVIILIVLILIGTTIFIRFLAKQITQPLLQLTETANLFVGGENFVSANIDSNDEIGTLAKTFNALTQQVNQTLGTLEKTVTDRTLALERRALQMETSAVVAREAASIRDVDELLDRVVQLIPERFGFYHAGIFLLDDNNEYAILQSTNSEGGQRMLARGHKLQVGKVGVVGYAAGTGESRVAQDVGADVVYYDNPDMPTTKSELALPLKSHEKVIGVLDVQSSEPNAFTREDIQTMEILVDQIALAIENASLLETSQKALEEIQVLYAENVRNAWQSRLENKEIAENYDSINVKTKKQKPSTLSSNNKLVKKIEYRGQVIGEIELGRDSDGATWSEDDEILIEEVLEQTALALENARLVSQIRLRSDQTQLLQEITAFAASLTEEETLLTTVATQLQSGLDLINCNIVLFNDENSACQMVANVPTGDVELGETITLEGNEVILEVIRTKSVKVIYDIDNNTGIGIAKNMMLERGAFTWVILPILVRGRVIGSINLEIGDPDRKAEKEDLNLFNQISAQVSSALDSGRLFQAEQRGREAAAAMLEISNIAGSSLDLTHVLKEVTQRSAAAVRADRCTVFLVEENSQTIRPLMSQFADPNKADPELWEKFKTFGNDPIDVPIFQVVAKERKPIIIDINNETELTDRTWLEPFNTSILLILPLVSQDRVIGIQSFDIIDPAGSFDNEQIELAQTIAAQVATTIENANLFNQTVQRAERERLVADITSKVRASNDPQVILQTAVNELRTALNESKIEVKTQSNDQENGVNGKNKSEV